MNIAVEVHPSSGEAAPLKEVPGDAKTTSRRLSLPDLASIMQQQRLQLKPTKMSFESPTKVSSPEDVLASKKDSSPSPSKRYEFEHRRQSFVRDSEEDKAVREVFKPQRQYFPSQRRRASLPTTASEKFRVGGGVSKQLRLARRSFHMHVQPPPKLEQVESAFERRRKQQQLEEGALYAATRATEKATRSWKRKTIVLGPLGLVSDNDEEESEAKRKREQRRSLMALLEKDSNKHNTSLRSLNSLNEASENNTKKDKENENSGGYKLPFLISPQAVKEKQLREIFQQQKAAAKKKSQAEKKERNIEAANASKAANRATEEEEKAQVTGEQRPAVVVEEKKEDVPPLGKAKTAATKDPLRQEQLRMLKVALKEVAASKEPALRSLVSFENSMQQQQQQQAKAGKKNRRQSMPDMSSSKTTTDDSAAAKSAKKDRRSYMQRRSSAPDFSATVAALTQHGSNPEEALKEMSAMPKHMLVDIITAPARGMTQKEELNTTKTNGSKKKKGSSSPRSEQKGGDMSSSSHHQGSKNGKSSSKKKGSRRPGRLEESGDVYDWALAARMREENDRQAEGADLPGNGSSVLLPHPQVV